MTGISESILRAEIAALHMQIAEMFKSFHKIDGKTGRGVDDFWPELCKLVGMLPDDIRPPEIKEYSPYPGPMKTKKIEADDLL